MEHPVPIDARAASGFAGRRTHLSLRQAIPLGIGYGMMSSLVAPAVPAHLTTAVVMVLVPFTFAVSIGVSAWIVRGPVTSDRGVPRLGEAGPT